MAQLFLDDKLIYSPFLDGYELQGLTATVGVNKGGTAEIVMPPAHPAYNAFVSFRSVVTIYRQKKLIFRGRALYPADDFFGTRKITCEGERCFLHDAIVRPYLWQTDPATIFAELIAIYNSQVDSFKQFKVGRITVSDPNGYIRLESENAEDASAVLDKLVERVGGHITFTTNAAGEREINWLATLEGRSKQRIEFGENMLDFSRSGENTQLATRIIPYGAKDDTTGNRITIESVNGGVDYIQDDEAVALRGIITVAVYWDDVTEPANLLAKAKQELAVRKLLVTSLELSAVDMSDLDKDIDSFKAGDLVEVYSKPHHLHEDFLLSERKYDFLVPAQDKVVMGKELATLTGADVVGDRTIQSQLQTTARSLRADVQSSVAAARDDLTASLGSQVNTVDAYMTADGLLLEWGTLAMNVSATVTVGSLSLRAEPSTTSAVLATLTQGASVTVTSYGEEWCAVTYNGLSGYVATIYLSFGSATTADMHIDFPFPYSTAPTMQVTPIGDSPADMCCSVDGVSTTGANVHVASDVTMVYWFAIGKADIS